MIRLFLIGLSLIFLALPVGAQEARLLSGKHDTFTRLTLNLPSRIEWTLETWEDGAEIYFDSQSLSVDLSYAFNRIQRERLKDVSWNNNQSTLKLSFDCACEVKGFWHENSLLVFDIIDNPDLEKADIDPSEQEDADTDSPQQEGADTDPSGQEKAVPVAEETKSTVTIPLPTRSRSADLLAAKLAPKAEPKDEEPAGGEASPEALAVARDRLLKQFSRAASQGLLTPRKMLPETVVKPQMDAQNAQEQVEEPPAPIEDLPPQINLKAESSIDHDFIESLPGASQNASTQGCVPDHQIDVASWGNDAPFGEQISSLRLRLTGEFDELDPDVAQELVRRYLYFGFGVEARDILSMLPGRTYENEILSLLAEIAENGYVEDNELLANQLDCDSPAALWSALSYQELPRHLPLDSDAVLRAFNGLPAHLRTYFGPILSRRFLDAGKLDVAETLLRILERPEDPPTPEMNMAKADAEKAAGAEEIAEEHLEDVVNSNSLSSAEALITLIEDRVKRGDPVSFEQAQLAGAYAFENQNEDIAPALNAAHIRALAASQAFDLAFQTYQESNSILDEGQASLVFSDMMRLLNKNADEITYLHHSMGLEPQTIAALDPMVANTSAQRLLNLGFPDAASKFVEQDISKQPVAARERQLLRAQIALAQQKPRQAIVDLLDLDGPDVNLLRAYALSAVGDHASAYHLFNSADQSDKAREAAWLEGDWANAVEPDVPAYEAFAQIRASQGTTGADNELPETTLARNRSLLTASESTRETLAALLEANSMPDEP